MDKKFEKQLLDSFYVHRPLEIDASKAVETRALNKKVLHRVKLWNGKTLAPWCFEGDGEAIATPDGGLAMKSWSRSEQWPENEARAVNANAGDYATFGSYVARLDVSGLDLSRGNRIRFDIFSNCHGLHSPIVRTAFVNNGKVKIPDVYSREGFHAMNLANKQWNAMSWEIEAIAHDKVQEISFTMHRYGKEISSGEELNFEIRNIYLEEVETPEVVHGWHCLRNTAVFSTTGYFTGGAKTAIANTEEKEFTLIDEDDNVVFKAEIARKNTQQGEFEVLDFSKFSSQGRYKIRFGNYTSDSFEIADDIFERAVWKLVNFMYCERCGYPVPNKHGTCHLDVYAKHKGVIMPYCGGWHDAADVSQQAVQTAEIMNAMLEAAQALKSKNDLLYKRLLEEANWGLDFVLRTRFGDGFRATNSAMRRWTDSLIGNMDDCDVNCHNHSFENFMCAGAEAFAAKCFAESDAELAWKCTDAAKEDYAWAVQRFKEVGLEDVVLHEHTSCAGYSQYYAVACWAAAQLFAVTQEDEYAAFTAEFAEKLAL